MTKKKRSSTLIWNIIALITSFGLLLLYILTRGHGVKSRQELAVHHLPSAEENHMKEFPPAKSINRKRNKVLNDALWTSKPLIPRKLQNIDLKLNAKSNNLTIRYTGNLHDIGQKPLSDSTPSQTTPSNTDKPTTPITTISITTPTYTEAPTTPITTQSITTPLVTEPGHKDITTEQTPDIDPNETIKLIRRRRANGFTPTSPNPITSSVSPLKCGNDTNYAYADLNGDCVCGFEKTGPDCQTDTTAQQQATLSASSAVFNLKMKGDFSGEASRKEFHDALETYYMDMEGFDHIFIRPLVYNATTNMTTLEYTVFFKNATIASQINTASSITGNITRDIFPLTVKNTRIIFSENENFLVRDVVGGTIEFIPIGSEAAQEICYIYNKTQACKNGGVCVPENGKPKCLCPTSAVGPYCEDKVLLAAASEPDPTLPILLPVLAAAAGVAVGCSCCWFFCRRANKGRDEYASFSSTYTESIPSVILPRYFPYKYKQGFGGAEFNGEPPIIVERPVVQPVLVERIVEHPRPVRVERVVEEEVIRRPVVVERIVPLDDEEPIRIAQDAHNVTHSSDDLSWMFGQQSHDRFRIRRPSVSSHADSRFNFFSSKYSY